MSEHSMSATEAVADQGAAIGSMEEQLVSLYSERVSLEREIGKSDAKEILGIIRTLNDRVTELETFRESAIRQQRILEREFGTSDPVLIVSRVRALNDLVGDLELRIAQAKTPLSALPDAQ